MLGVKENDVTRIASEVARTEGDAAAHAAVASLCGLILRRLQDEDDNAKGGTVTFEDLNAIFGEALEQFS